LLLTVLIPNGTANAASAAAYGMKVPIATPADYKSYVVKTQDGLSISVQEWGNPKGPDILFIHGMSHSHLAWLKQTRSDLAKTFRMVTFDLRGHGMSDKPTPGYYYKENKRWADEVQSVINGANLKKPILVGWSMAGRVICDYLIYYSDSGISGINFVDTTTNTDPKLKLFGPGAALLGAMHNDNMEVNITGTIRFVQACTNKPLPDNEFNLMIASNMMCPPAFRQGISGREANYGDVLAKITVPVLITAGKKDTIDLPAMAEYQASVIKHAKLSWFEEAGHMPFWEFPEQFNIELAEFVNSSWIGKK
jgi:non-heme chloroperoxidase